MCVCGAGAGGEGGRPDRDNINMYISLHYPCGDFCLMVKVVSGSNWSAAASVVHRLCTCDLRPASPADESAKYIQNFHALDVLCGLLRTPYQSPCC